MEGIEKREARRDEREMEEGKKLWGREVNTRMKRGKERKAEKKE